MRLLLILLFVSVNACANNALSALDSILSNRQAKKVFPQQQKSQFTVINSNIISSSVFALSKHYQFILFYRATCSHCRRFDPALKEYSDDSGIPVKAFTFDGSLPSFPNSTVVSRNVISTYFGNNINIAVPTLFIINVTNGHAYPVSSGELNYQELSMRMNQLALKIWQVEGRGNA